MSKDLMNQIFAGIVILVLSAIMAWAGHIQSRLEEVDANLVRKDVLEYRSRVYQERLDSAIKRVVRLENEVYLLGRKK